MSEFRENLVSGRWVIVLTSGTRDAASGLEFVGKGRGTREDEGADYDPKCPYCGGNEHMTLPEVSLIRGQDGSDSGEWIVRVVPNNQGVLRPTGEPVVRRHHIHQFITGVGTHEIVVESPHHSVQPYDQSLDRFAAIIGAYRDRVAALETDRHFEYVSVIRNHGIERGLGTSHPCSEIVALPFVPVDVQAELKQSEDYYEFSSSCVVCDLIQSELSAETRVLLRSDAFVAIAPYAARVPYEIWILPTRHASSFVAITDAEAREMAFCLGRVLLALAEDLGDPPYSYYIHTAPARAGDMSYYHWHLELIPRVTAVTGIEYGTGIPVNPMSPEQSAAFLSRKLTVH
ncbi:MAG: hypothetical protein WBK63_07670 [Bacillota bacterium]